MDEMINSENKRPAYTRPAFVFSVVWLIVFILYLPARNAGWVSDTCEWLQKIRTEKFLDFINVKQSRGSLYQFTQLATYIFYRLFKENTVAWHLLFITIHAANCTLLYIVCKKLFEQSAVKDSVMIAYGAVILFAVCPHISEVIVWKASYHYLQALLLMLVNLYWAQQFLNTSRIKYAVYGVILFSLSIFSHEFFYLTPFFVLSLAIYYRFVLNAEKTVSRKAILYFVIPFFLLCIVHLLLVRMASGGFSADIGDEINQPLKGYFRKPPSYIYHILFFGRFFSPQSREVVYNFFVSKGGIIVVYGLFSVFCGYILLRFKHFSFKGKAAILVLSWMLMCMAIACPVWFGYIQTVQFDRYAYFMLPFIYLLLLFLITSLKIRELSITVFVVFAFINIYFTMRVNKDWKQSTQVVSHLLVPDAGNKTVLFLDVPANMNGVPMVGPFLHFSFRQMYNLVNTQKINNTAYDVVSYNMLAPDNGAHVMVINDSMIHVTLNQWATWWWYGMVGAFSYQNEDYKVNMIDPGHWYELTLRRPSSQYLLLYQVGDTWKAVDIALRNDQY